jgi:hypothetical protein
MIVEVGTLTLCFAPSTSVRSVVDVLLSVNAFKDKLFMLMKGESVSDNCKR